MHIVEALYWYNLLPFYVYTYIGIYSKMWNFWSIFHFYIDSREDTPEDGSSEGRKTVTSTIKFRPTSRDNLASYACEAQHPALDSPQRVEVFLSVMCKYKVYGEYILLYFFSYIYITAFYYFKKWFSNNNIVILSKVARSS